MTYTLFLLFLVDVLLKQSSGLPGPDRSGTVGIFGGHEIPIEAAPYMASLRARYCKMGSISHMCGASIIHERFVLTGAPCCKIANPKFKVVVGTENQNGDGGELLDVEDIAVHEGFSYEYGEYNACLVKLKKALTFGPKVSKITLATPSFKVPRVTNFNITGWGDTESGYMASKLRQVEVPKVPHDKCQDIYSDIPYNITSRMICAGNFGNSACIGDSGGPLTYGNVQVGIAYFVEECGTHYPTVFTKVAPVYWWIMQKIYFEQ